MDDDNLHDEMIECLRETLLSASPEVYESLTNSGFVDAVESNVATLAAAIEDAAAILDNHSDGTLGLNLGHPRARHWPSRYAEIARSLQRASDRLSAAALHAIARAERIESQALEAYRTGWRPGKSGLI